MPGLGTIINAALLTLGGVLGLLIGRAIKPSLKDAMIMACGISVIFIGGGGAIAGMLVRDGEGFSTTGGMMLVASLCIGGLVGEMIDIERGCEKLGVWLRKRSHSEGDTSFIDGFLTASLTVCIGAMAVIGPVRDALYGDISILVTKGILDAVIVMALASTMGRGTVFSVVPLVIFQGAMTLFAVLLEGIMNEAATAALSTVGSVLIFCVGINLTFGKKVKVANFLPALIVAVVWSYLPIGL
ncbi:MAG: DUF554 domain-containing protein [Clostridia bacterium]|nr:DUF554 domain-containing protein [Clostridia bacterium]